MTLVTHKYLKDLYFEYKNNGDELDLSDEQKEAIEDYLDMIDEYEEKRNWENAENMDDHTEMFAKRLLNQ